MDNLRGIGHTFLTTKSCYTTLNLIKATKCIYLLMWKQEVDKQLK